MSVIRVGCVGVGGMGGNHVKAVSDIKNAELVAVCDIIEATAKRVGEQYSVPFYTDHRAMLKKEKLDAITIATPHPQHRPVAVAALNAKKHVFTEKPMASTVSDCDLMIAAAKKNRKRLCVMYQQRTKAVNHEARRIIKSGEIGTLIRVNMVSSSMRTQAYYDSGGWRGTWDGEGGGVLLNQAPHQIDLLLWLTGPPKRVMGHVSTFGHEIEVEDTASALMEYPNGAHGCIQVSTVEAPGMSRYEIVGTKGRIVLEGSRLRMNVLEQPSDQFIKTNKEMWGSVKGEWKDIEVKPDAATHVEGVTAMIQDFIDSLIEKRASLCPAEEGRMSVELANAMIMSSVTGKPVDLPIDAKKYDGILKKLIRQKGLM
ncbi:MAG: Gfo/Idh/MocA family oxidoreductase [Planctomycetota bacterium]